ncbi:MAG: integration host factor, actinobacterial type [Clostridia bacterium]|jgi:hypothetical protein|nr:integration host factor, actinobacterial type [Clostridia bacterium]MDD4571514.1 integration host factor, actinobacterial type [Clostridia bacterium]
MVIPKLSQEDRAKALQKAQQMRSKRTELRAELKAGKVTLAQVLSKAEADEVIGKMRVKYLLESLPQVGKITAAKIMEEIGIDEARRIQGLGNRQKTQLLERLA